MNVYLEKSSNEVVFNSSKYQYEKTLRGSGYTDFKPELNETRKNHTKRISAA